jgi:hypothetical protein
MNNDELKAYLLGFSGDEAAPEDDTPEAKARRWLIATKPALADLRARMDVRKQEVADEDN